jgi:hypothetical protein
VIANFDGVIPELEELTDLILIFRNTIQHLRILGSEANQPIDSVETDAIKEITVWRRVQRLKISEKLVINNRHLVQRIDEKISFLFHV